MFWRTAAAGRTPRVGVVAAALAGGLAGGAGCQGAITLTVTGDLPVPGGVDAICVGVADHDAHGGQFGRVYQLAGKLASWPQTLAVAPGSASAADAWVLGYHGGVVVAHDRAAIDFGGDVTLRLDACRRGRAGAAAIVGSDTGAATRVVGSIGKSGTVVIALGGTGRVLDAVGGAVTVLAPLATPAIVRDAIAFDADGDCDDDLAIASDAGPPHLWLRGPGGPADFHDAGALGTAAARALAAADVDGDGDLDLIVGGGARLALLRNDGAGRFTEDPAAFAGAAGATDVTALAAGDLDGDGRADLVVGQGAAAAAPLLAMVGAGAGFAPAPAILPAVSVRVVRASLVDADGDRDLDLVLALADAAPRLYVNRGGFLEDQSFVRLPQPSPVAAAAAIATWDDDCAPDLALAAPGGTQLGRGSDGGGFTVVDPGAAPAAVDAAFIDVDDDGVADLITAGPGGVTWVRR